MLQIIVILQIFDFIKRFIKRQSKMNLFDFIKS